MRAPNNEMVLVGPFGMNGQRILEVLKNCEAIFEEATKSESNVGFYFDRSELSNLQMRYNMHCLFEKQTAEFLNDSLKQAGLPYHLECEGWMTESPGMLFVYSVGRSDSTEASTEARALLDA